MGVERRLKLRAIGPVLALLLLATSVGTLVHAQGRDSEQRPRRDGEGTVDDGLALIDTRPHEVQAAAPAASIPTSLVPTEEQLQLDLHSRLMDVAIKSTPQGDIVRVETDSGPVDLTPEQYVHALGETQTRVQHGGWLYRILNISRPWSIVWISVGLLGQVMFTIRMLIQWWASEKHKRSVVPIGFWWGSLFGGALLFAYFCWRKDAIGILGQSTGVFIYARNLVLIYRGQAIEAEGARPIPVPVAEPVADAVATPRAT
jgi:lipid-A-disaccharide synthase-like uncharacterized protein